jgi:hypothetical protein
MPPDSISRIALRWTADGKWNTGRPKEIWRETVEKEMKAKRLITSPRIEVDGGLELMPYGTNFGSYLETQLSNFIPELSNLMD